MIDNFFNRFNRYLGYITAITMLLLMLNVFVDVVLRYFFNMTNIALQEMEWHLFSVMFLFGISYALQSEGHVRVDFAYERFSTKVKTVINIFGTIFFLIPFAILIIYGSYEFVNDAYIVNEISEDPGGLTHRWIIKAMIPISFIVLIIAAIGYIYQNYKTLKESSK